jgi:hypothetical protein
MTLSAQKTSSAGVRWLVSGVLLLAGAWVVPVRGQTYPATTTTTTTGVGRATRAQFDYQRAWFKTRMQQDRRRYSREAVSDADAAYAELAAKQWRGAEAAGVLRTMLEKFPELNRTGCAVLNYAISAETDDEREQYLRRAVDKHSDCFYEDGVQVGGMARYLLGHHYRAHGKTAEADKLFDEIRAHFPEALTHARERLVAVIDAEGRSGKQSVPATLPAD